MMLRRASLLFVASILLACGEHDLRGKWVRSQDGGTYLVVDEQDGPACTAIYIDRQPWPHRVHEPGTMSPGNHHISCGPDAAYLAFDAPTGMTYHFNYWGP